MNTPWKGSRLLMLAVALIASPPLRAGPYSDDLAKCLVESTTKDDRISLVRWMFASASAHPAVASIASVSPQVLDDANKLTGELVTRLLTVSCKTQTQKAFRYEGKDTFKLSFQVLGQVAGTEMFADPAVAKATAGLSKYIDAEKIQAIVK